MNGNGNGSRFCRSSCNPPNPAIGRSAVVAVVGLPLSSLVSCPSPAVAARCSQSRSASAFPEFRDEPRFGKAAPERGRVVSGKALPNLAMGPAPAPSRRSRGPLIRLHDDHRQRTRCGFEPGNAPIDPSSAVTRPPRLTLPRAGQKGTNVAAVTPAASTTGRRSGIPRRVEPGLSAHWRALVLATPRGTCALRSSGRACFLRGRGGTPSTSRGPAASR